MKKVLATVAALGLVLGVTANALALDKPGTQAQTEAETAPRVPTPTAPGVALWSVKGSWVLAGAYLQDGLGLGFADLNDQSDSNDDFYIYSFKLLPVLQVNDKIAMKGEFRFADRDVFGAGDTDLEGGRQIDAYQVYMEWTSPWGKTRFGRTPAGAWGSNFLNSSTQGNRLMWWLNMLPENWGSLLFTQKMVEEDATTLSSDGDQDAYYADLSYAADFGKTVGALFFVRNATAGRDPSMSQRFWLWGNYTFDALSLEYEFQYHFGEVSDTVDEDKMGFYADLGYKMQDWKFGGLFWYASGDDDGNADGENSALGALGNDFNPFQILTGDYMGILNGDNPLTAAGNDADADAIAAGSWAIQGYASFAVSPALSVNGYLGYAAALEEQSGWDTDMGLEAGIGFGYKIMDNLSYGAHFSYLWTGDFFTRGGVAETDDVYLLAHSLSMSF